MAVDRPVVSSGALPCVAGDLRCPGCDRPFQPGHWRQTHCRPACRVLALRRRRLTEALAVSPATAGVRLKVRRLAAQVRELGRALGVDV
jgi:hypothetical protein